jgi:hypothetical protein
MILLFFKLPVAVIRNWMMNMLPLWLNWEEGNHLLHLLLHGFKQTLQSLHTGKQQPEYFSICKLLNWKDLLCSQVCQINMVDLCHPAMSPHLLVPTNHHHLVIEI